MNALAPFLKLLICFITIDIVQLYLGATFPNRIELIKLWILNSGPHFIHVVNKYSNDKNRQTKRIPHKLHIFMVNAKQKLSLSYLVWYGCNVLKNIYIWIQILNEFTWWSMIRSICSNPKTVKSNQIKIQYSLIQHSMTHAWNSVALDRM